MMVVRFGFLEKWLSAVVWLLVIAFCWLRPSAVCQAQERVFEIKGVCFKMIKVEGGAFLMGAGPEQMDEAVDREFPVHKVWLEDFEIGETEVTQELWQAVMGRNPSEFKGKKRPVERVSWKDCQRFIRRLNELTGEMFRLPSEAEWEFAARGGNRSKGFKYSGGEELDSVAWFWDNSAWATHEVAQKLPNELGLFDLTGNVFEWCADWEAPYSDSDQSNPTGPSSGSLRVIRGGHFLTGAKLCRIPYRIGFDPSKKHYSIGLRLAL